MDAFELVTELEHRGATLQVFGTRLRIRPRESVSPELLEELRAHKREIVDFVRSRATVEETLPGSVEPTSIRGHDALAMPLCRFASAGLVVPVVSEVLGETIVLASDNACLDPGERRIVYRAAELRELLGLHPRDLSGIHEIKEAGGSIMPN